LVFQAFLGAVAIDASATPPQLDFFGNIICTSHGAVTLPDSGDPAEPRQAPDCCTLGCYMLWHAASVPEASGFAVRLADGTSTGFCSRSPHRAPRPEGCPGNPRAPPLSV